MGLSTSKLSSGPKGSDSESEGSDLVLEGSDSVLQVWSGQLKQFTLEKEIKTGGVKQCSVLIAINTRTAEGFFAHLYPRNHNIPNPGGWCDTVYTEVNKKPEEWISVWVLTKDSCELNYLDYQTKVKALSAHQIFECRVDNGSDGGVEVKFDLKTFMIKTFIWYPMQFVPKEGPRFDYSSFKPVGMPKSLLAGAPDGARLGDTSDHKAADLVTPAESSTPLLSQQLNPRGRHAGSCCVIQ